jgi:hypothetical protein
LVAEQQVDVEVAVAFDHDAGHRGVENCTGCQVGGVRHRTNRRNTDG